MSCGLCRENTEGEYSGLEHEVVPDVVESLKVCVPPIFKPLISCKTLFARPWRRATPFPRTTQLSRRIGARSCIAFWTDIVMILLERSEQMLPGI